jgi:hypothetical protein
MRSSTAYYVATIAGGIFFAPAFEFADESGEFFSVTWHRHYISARQVG